MICDFQRARNRFPIQPRRREHNKVSFNRRRESRAFRAYLHPHGAGVRTSLDSISRHGRGMRQARGVLRFSWKAGEELRLQPRERKGNSDSLLQPQWAERCHRFLGQDTNLGLESTTVCLGGSEFQGLAQLLHRHRDILASRWLQVCHHSSKRSSPQFISPSVLSFFGVGCWSVASAVLWSSSKQC